MSEVDTTPWKLATSEASARDYKQRLEHQARLNTVLVEQNAVLINRNTALEKQLAAHELAQP